MCQRSAPSASLPTNVDKVTEHLPLLNTCRPHADLKNENPTDCIVDIAMWGANRFFCGDAAGGRYCGADGAHLDVPARPGRSFLAKAVK